MDHSNLFSRTFFCAATALGLSLGACAGDDAELPPSSAAESAIIGGSEAPANAYPGLVSRSLSPCTGRGVYTRVEDHHAWVRDIIDSSI